MRAFVYEGDRRAPDVTEAEIPPSELLPSSPRSYREKLMDEVAENSDALMERYLEGERDLPRGDRSGR